MQKILLVNLMRMGDILQTGPLIEGLRESHPGSRITLMLNEAFQEVGSRIEPDRVIPFPVRAFTERIRREEELRWGVDELQGFIRQVNLQGPYDWVVNLTPSRSAACLASLFPHRFYRGMRLEGDGTVQTTDPWSSYLAALLAHRRGNPFHLVDIWLRSLGLRGGRPLRFRSTARDVEAARELLAAAGVNPETEVLIGFQASASQEQKCWSEKEFVRLGQALHRGLQARVLLFGVKSERETCDRIGHGIPGAVNLAGETGLGELAGLLRLCRLLVSNDTGTLHLATAVGTPVIVVSLGPVLFRETGPYGEGHWVFQARLPCAPCAFRTNCLNPVCKDHIRAEPVYELALQMVRGNVPTSLDLPSEVSCYRTGFDGDGWLTFLPLRPSPEDRALALHRDLWLGLLEGRPLPETGAWTGVLDPEVSRDWLRLGSVLGRSASLVRQIFDLAAGRTQGPGRWDVLNANLGESEQELRRLALEARDMAPIVNYLLLRRESVSTGDPLVFLEQTSSIYGAAASVLTRAAEALQAEEPGRQRREPSASASRGDDGAIPAWGHDWNVPRVSVS